MRPTKHRKDIPSPLAFMIVLAGLVLTISLVQSDTVWSTPAPVAPSIPTKVSPELREEFTRNGNVAHYLIMLSEQANTANGIRDWNAKGRYVFDRLKEVADRTQPSVVALLNKQKSLGNVRSFKNYIIVNALGVEGNLTSTYELADLPQVSRIDAFPLITFPEQPKVDVTFSPEGTPPPTLCPSCVASNPPTGIEWNVSMVRAPQAWAMGYDGRGITVGVIDTGVHFSHEALVEKYRGNLGGIFDHNYNWFDPFRGVQYPYDTPTGHGTRVTGVVLGSNGIGVAPGANWIAVNPIGTARNDQDIVSSMDFMLAHWDLTGQNRNPSMRPHVVSNSWNANNSATMSCPVPEDNPLLLMIRQWVNAGIFPSFAAGNGGDNGNTYPDAFPETFETGALTIYGVRAGYSSVGPSCIERGDRQLPQIMAGGGDCPEYSLGVLSSNNAGDAAYCRTLGTSFAQPATAGAVAILLQANPSLSVQEIWNILITTASWDEKWGTRPNHVYGWGLLQIDAAVQMVLGPTPTPTPTTVGGGGPTPTPTPTTAGGGGGPTPTPTPTTCPVRFTDVPWGSPFYNYVHCLYCRNIISGYFDNERCPGGVPCFRPDDIISRGAACKFVSNAAGFNESISNTRQTFTDVPPTHPFWLWIERLVARGIVSGYNDAANCPTGIPCFNPNREASRGVLVKMAVNAKYWQNTIPSNRQTFEDVPASNPFWYWFEVAYLHRGEADTLGGFRQPGRGEINPCTAQVEDNRFFYVRPCLIATRGETARCITKTWVDVNGYHCIVDGSPSPPEDDMPDMPDMPGMPGVPGMPEVPMLTPSASVSPSTSPAITPTPSYTSTLPTSTRPPVPTPPPTAPVPIPTSSSPLPIRTATTSVP